MEVLFDGFEVCDYGCDYIRLVAPTLEVLRPCVDALSATAEPAVQGNWKDYQGYWAGAMFYGSRTDGSMLQISGCAAKGEVLRGLHAAHATRIDLQVTFIATDKPTIFIDALYDHVEEMVRRGIAPANVRTTSIRNIRGGSTLYVGARSSERMIRIYDKSLEDEEYEVPRAMRFEVEYKGDMARKVYAAYEDDYALLDTVFAEINRFASRYNLPVDRRIQIRGNAIPPSSPKETSKAAKLKWLATGVRPTVAKLKDCGVEGAHLRSILGLDPLDD